MQQEKCNSNGKRLSKQEDCRRKMVKLCALTLNRHHKRTQSSSDLESKACAERIVKQARCIELLLHLDASTYEEYVDRSTFPRRFVTVILNYQNRKNRKGDIDRTMMDLSERFGSLW